MKILEKEISLREETRGIQQAKPQMDPDRYLVDAGDLAGTQKELAVRTQAVVEKILEMENAEAFENEVAQLNNAGIAMSDGVEILTQPDTGAPAIAAETEAIEWLLMAKRSKGGGGGGGDAPGESAREVQNLASSALALLGEANEEQAQVQQRVVQQATGKSGKEAAEEFRYGLDKYFESLEKNK